MDQQLTEILNYFLEDYIQGKKQIFGKSASAYNSICISAPNKIYETKLVNRDEYKVEGSVGQGNWAKVPWLAIFRKDITSSAQSGVYIVYLLSSDGNTLFLTLNQGVTEISQNATNSEVFDALRENAKHLTVQLDKRNFLSDENIFLGSDITTLGKKYQKGTIFYKKYSKQNIPSEEVLREDLKNMLEIYQEYYDKIYKRNNTPAQKPSPIVVEKDMAKQKIFFGAPGTGKSYKVNAILGAERKKCFSESSENVKSNHYADVLCKKEYVDCDIWVIDNIGLLENKLAEFEAEDNRANPRHSALRAYIDFFKKYREENRVLRTTFHPDYDYAQFVGAYKPKKVQNGDDGSLSKEQLAQKLSEIFPTDGNGEIDKTTAITLFGLQYANSLKEKNMNEIVRLSEIGTDQYKSAYLSAAVKARLQFSNVDEKITYSFVPQVFAKAYATAWKLQLAGAADKSVFLVIEEINRGNCAQIFGDIFQLLDRDGDGFSQYSIDADCDFAEWLETDEKGLKFVWDKYKETVGEGKLKLPPNLNILATMNTSDQSLFPMDSAFKRRFDWEYVPISFTDEEGNEKEAAKYEIDVPDANGENYLWKNFVEAVNDKILDLTESEDKQLGEFFIKPESGNVISKDRFLGKVMFYLWNEVCKDEHKNGSFFRTKDGDKEKYFTFQDLYRNKDLLKQFMDELLNGKS